MQWKLGFLIGTPIGIILAIASAIAAVHLWKASKRWIADDYSPDAMDKFMFRSPAAAAALTAVAAIGIMAGSNIPFKAEYLQWRPVTGVVEQADSRFNSRGEGVSEVYVLTIDGQPYRVDDNRAITVDEGDTVSLMCTREWQWAASDGYSCRWGE